jgi:D-arabinose 1-dehydrogenase-like Zn-dependent alcohol dehydrogenase
MVSLGAWLRPAGSVAAGHNHVAGNRSSGALTPGVFLIMRIISHSESYRRPAYVQQLDGKVAIVTGAARGLGRAYAKRLAGLGAKVAVADLNLRSYEEFEAEAKDMTADSTVAEIEASGGAAIGIEVAVRDHEAVEAMVARVVRAWGRVDVLVANAGGGRGRPVDTKASTLDPRS